jgi:hypothetical protein
MLLVFLSPRHFLLFLITTVLDCIRRLLLSPVFVHDLSSDFGFDVSSIVRDCFLSFRDSLTVFNIS